MPKKHVHRSKEEYQKTVSEARKRWKIKERTMKEMFRVNEAGAMLIQKQLLATNTSVLDVLEDNFCCNESVIASVVIAEQERSTISTISIESSDIVDTEDTLVYEDFIDVDNAQTMDASTHKHFDE